MTPLGRGEKARFLCLLARKGEDFQALIDPNKY